MKKKLISIGVVVLVLALLVTLAPSCGKKEGEVKTLKIAVLTPLSGPAAPWGLPQEQGAKWAADKINEEGGIKVGDDRYMVEIKSFDSKMTGSVAAEEATKIVYDENIHYVVGPITTYTATQQIFEDGKCFNTPISWAKTSSPEYPHSINCVTYAPYWTLSLYGMMTSDHPEVKNEIIIDPNSEGGHVSADATETACLEYGIVVLDKEFYETGTTDFYPLLTRVIAKNPDCIDLSGSSPGDQALMVKQARELGYEGRMWASTQCPIELLLETAGAEAAEGYASQEINFESPVAPEGMRDLFREYCQRYNETHMNWVVWLGYGTVMMFAQAMEEAESTDPEAVMQVLDDPDWKFEFWGFESQLGGLETTGIRRNVANYQFYSEVIDGKLVTKDVDFVVIP